MDRDLQTTLEPIASQLHWPVLQVFRHPRGTVSVAEAASADLDRRPLPRRIASYRTAWGRLAPCRRDRRIAAAAAGNASASEYVATPDRSGGARFFGAYDLL